MTEYDASTYGEVIASAYDELHGYLLDPAPALDFLLAAAGGGRALELGIGTGRIAIPLHQRGVAIHGIDASPAMIAAMRSKPGGAAIPVTLGDFTDVPVDGAYDLIFVVFNTFYSLLTQDEQIRCFAGVASHLGAGGRFVIEAFVPDLTRFNRRERTSVIKLGLDNVQLDTSQVNPSTQRIDATHIVITEQGNRLYPVRLRYVWPSELDLMARLAGLRLIDRWGGWRHEPYGPDCQTHVSVYGR